MGVYVDMASAQFENQNSLRLYPFSSESSLVDSVGRELPLGAIVDLRMVVPAAIGNPDSFSEGGVPVVYMTSFHVSKSMVSACFMSGNAALSVTVSADDFRPYFPYRLEKLAGSDDIGGVVTFGEIEFPGFPETYFMKDADGNRTAIVHRCCVAAARPPALRKFVDRRSGESLSGDVQIDFSGYVNSEKSGKSFRLALDDGASVELASECAKVSGADACGATPIVSINGVRPDENGNIVLWFH